VYLVTATSLNPYNNLAGGKLPSWVKLPKSVAVPFGAMERVLDLPDNADAKAELAEKVAAIDTSSEVRSVHPRVHMRPPRRCREPSRL
jgi:hypothetical protein